MAIHNDDELIGNLDVYVNEEANDEHRELDANNSKSQHLSEAGIKFYGYKKKSKSKKGRNGNI